MPEPAAVRRPRLLPAALALYAAFLAVALLVPRGDVPTTAVHALTDLVHGLGADPSFVTAARVEVVANVVIMVPLALLGRLLRPAYGWRDWTAVGFAIALGVELVQGLLLPERTASALDVVANTTGVAGGAALGSLLRTSRSRGRGTGRTVHRGR